MSSIRRRRTRRASALLVLVALFATVLGVGSASGDEISDKRAEAAEVADQVEELEHTAEILTEEYNDARLALADVEAKAVEAQERAGRTQAQVEARKREMAAYAVAAYMNGGQSESLSFLDAQNGTEASSLKSYTRVTQGGRADALDRFRAAKAAAEADQRFLAAAKSEAADAAADVEAKKSAAEEAVAKEAAVLDKVQGELATLVAAEQARRAAAAAAKAREEAARLAAQQEAAAEQAAADRPPAATTEGTGPSAQEPSDGGGTEPEAPSTPAPAAPPVGVGADAAIAAARSMLGVRYTWGGETPETGFDCSGFTKWSWAHGGKSLPHSSRAQYGMSRRIPMSEIQPGDLVFYGSPVHHVALYIGGGQIIHAPNRRSVVRIDSVNYWSSLVGAGRI